MKINSVEYNLFISSMKHLLLENKDIKWTLLYSFMNDKDKYESGTQIIRAHKYDISICTICLMLESINEIERVSNPYSSTENGMEFFYAIKPFKLPVEIIQENPKHIITAEKEEE